MGNYIGDLGGRNVLVVFFTFGESCREEAGSMNEVMLFYIGVILFGIFAAIMVYTGKMEKKRK